MEQVSVWPHLPSGLVGRVGRLEIGRHPPAQAVPPTEMDPPPSILFHGQHLRIPVAAPYPTSLGGAQSSALVSPSLLLQENHIHN